MKYDVIVIGTGQSGPFLAKKFAAKGFKVAIIEKGNFGGTCINTGCTPTKTLVANAKVAHVVKNSQFYGVKVPSFRIDYKAIKRRKDKLVSDGTKWVKKSLKATPGCTVYEGNGAFVSPFRVKVGKKILEADKIFINVGAKARIPDIKGLDTIPYLTNKTLLDLKTLPKHLLILGGGYVGIEFAQIYRRLGSKVTIIQRPPTIMKKEDPEISKVLQQILRKEGIEIYTNVKNFEVLSGSLAGKIVVKVGRKKISGSHLLIAVGRVPDIHDLGLTNAEIKLDKGGYIQVDDKLRTSNPRVWALGDCNGRGAFTHTSYNDYEIVAENLLEGGDRKVTDRFPIYALYTDPPLGRVGLNEKEAKEKYKNVRIATLPMTQVARAREKGETEGFLKILIDGDTKQIIGASFLGIHCDEVIQLITLAMTAKLPLTIFEKFVGIHPTVSELIPTLLETL